MSFKHFFKEWSIDIWFKNFNLVYCYYYCLHVTKGFDYLQDKMKYCLFRFVH